MRILKEKTKTGFRLITVSMSVIGALASLVGTLAISWFGLAGSGHILVSTYPSNAQVFLEDTLKGNSPCKIDVDEGFHKVSARLQGFETSEEIVEVKTRESVPVEFRLNAVGMDSEALRMRSELDSIKSEISKMGTLAKQTAFDPTNSLLNLTKEMSALKNDIGGARAGLFK